MIRILICIVVTVAYMICFAALLFAMFIFNRNFWWLEYRARRIKKKLPKDYKEKTKQFLKENAPDEIEVKFQSLYFNDTLSARAKRKRNSKVLKIYFAKEWIFRILFDNNENHDLLMDTYFETIGHEESHFTIDRMPRELSDIVHIKRYIMKCWADEIHADFGACEKKLGNNRERLLKVLRNKKRIQDEVVRKDRRWLTHPSWSDRINYAEYFDFDEKLLQ